MQNAIRAGVHSRSNGAYLIPVQDEDSLKIIMRAIFLQNATNLPFNLTDQIVALNDLVCEYAIPKIYNEAQGYLTYKHDISTMYTPMARPQYSDYKTTSLQLKHWFWGVFEGVKDFILHARRWAAYSIFCKRVCSLMSRLQFALFRSLYGSWILRACHFCSCCIMTLIYRFCHTLAPNRAECQ